MISQPSARLARAFALLLVLLAAFVPTAGFSQTRTGGAEASPLVRVRIANLGVSIASMPQQWAIERGVFAKHGIDLQVINFVRGGAEATAGVASGQVDMGVFGTPILTGISFGLPIKIVGSPPLKGNNFELVARKGIDSVKDLKGKTVTCGALGGGSHQSLLKILWDNGLTENDVKIVATGGTDAEMILRSGKVEAVITSEPTRIKLIDEGRGTLIARASDYYGRYQHSFVFATNEFIKTHPEAVAKYFVATRESLDYSKTHLDELVEFSAKRVNLKKEIIREYFEEQFKKWDLSFSVDIEGTSNAVDIVKGFKEIKATTKFDPATWLDLRFL
jgi:NitT/TauT family transport system substrate-binding protein